MIQRLYKSKILLQAENSPTIAILLHFNGIRKEENISSGKHRSSLLILQYNKKAILVLVVSSVQWLSALTPMSNDIVQDGPLFFSEYQFSSMLW